MFREGAEYALKAVRPGGSGKELPEEVIKSNRQIKVVNRKDCAILISGQEVFAVNIRRVACATVLEYMTNEDGVFSMMTVSAGAPDAARMDRAELYINDRITGGRLTLASSEIKNANGRAECLFRMDFNEGRMNRDLYMSDRVLMIEYSGGGGEKISHEVISRKQFRTAKAWETLKLICARGKGGRVTFSFRQRWPEGQRTAAERRLLIGERYPAAMERPVDEKLILFESERGRQYGGDPRAVYEYIDEHYPEYRCLWALGDPRTPVKGGAGRIKRGSAEYYEVLARAKYLVNDADFPKDFVKRPEQKEMNTTCGIPLSMTGPYDREGPEAGKTWDLLLAQGKYMEDKAREIFGFEGGPVRSGAPRDDILLAERPEPETDDIRRRLRIPEGKKVILYAPEWRTRRFFDVKPDIARMRGELGGRYVLLVRVHHTASGKYDLPADDGFTFDLTGYGNVQDLMRISDIMITDYSPLLFDYALLDRPGILYLYDLDVYSEKLRGLRFDIREEAPYPVAYTTEDVIRLVREAEHGGSMFSQVRVTRKREAFIGRYLTYERGDASKKAAEALLGEGPGQKGPSGEKQPSGQKELSGQKKLSGQK